VANDFFVIPARSERPVLAHALIDFLLDPTNAQQNFEYVGYQPALTNPTAEELVAAELVPQNLLATLVTDDDVSGGYRLDALAPDVEKLWTEAYSSITAG
jgi:spermidine/putrescine-binding protein